MRLRNDPKAKEFLLKNKKIFILNEEKKIVDWDLQFTKNKILHLEIGMGKGQFIINKALKYPDINFIGLERNITICAKAVKKTLQIEENISNLKMICFEANDLLNLFNPYQIDIIYLNFSDPWPKKRHAKNRLTHPKYLAIYKQLLKLGGHIELKTDNEALYAYTLDIIKADGQYNLLYTTSNLYEVLDEPNNIDNIATEYENRFSKQKNINKIIFNFIDQSLLQIIK